MNNNENINQQETFDQYQNNDFYTQANYQAYPNVYAGGYGYVPYLQQMDRYSYPSYTGTTPTMQTFPATSGAPMMPTTQVTPTFPTVPPTPTGQVTGINVPGMLPIEQSYIENILRLNKGKVATVYMSFENRAENNPKVFRGVIEAAGRDHIILSDTKTGKRYILPMIYLDYITFDEEIIYEYPFR